MSFMAEDSRKNVTYESLEKITLLGLTDRRYRQLAKEGHFPEPVSGNYDFILTLRGLLKYYRDQQTSLAARKQAISDEQHRKLKRENDLADGVLVAKATVVAEFRKVVEPIKAIRIYGKRLEDDLLAEWQKLFAKLGV
jgi:hypothetical protein